MGGKYHKIDRKVIWKKEIQSIGFRGLSSVLFFILSLICYKLNILAFQLLLLSDKTCNYRPFLALVTSEGHYLLLFYRRNY